jgi:hypothetical protein
MNWGFAHGEYRWTGWLGFFNCFRPGPKAAETPEGE